MKVAYVSNGNIPSRWAHTVQVMKMSEALGACAQGFGLLVAGGACDWLRSPRTIHEYYGITRPFPIRRVPIAWRLPPGSLDRPDNHAFHLPAVRAVRLLRPALVWTRCHEVARQCLGHGFRVLFEVHSANEKAQRYLTRMGGEGGLAAVLTTAPVLAERYASLGVPARRILVERNGVDLRPFECAVDRDAVRERYGIGRDAFVAAYAGSLYAYKGIATLLAAAALQPDVTFLVAGGTREQVQGWRSAGVPANVHLLGHLPNRAVPELLLASDVGLVPNSAQDRTAAYTFSLKLYEYLAAGLPIVASDLPSLRAAVAEPAVGLLVTPDAAEPLAAAIAALRDDSGRRAALSRRAREVAADCSWDARARRVLARVAPELLRGDPPSGASRAPARRGA